MSHDYVLIIDTDSGWENDEDILWHTDEGNAVEWGEGAVTVLG